MPLLIFSDIETNADTIIRAIGHESVDVYRFLLGEFGRGSIQENYVFQFLYRSFYRLDNAGLTPDFKQTYFALLEQKRSNAELDLRDLSRELFVIPNRKGQQSLQFSFVSKLANTINPEYPIYDKEVARVFAFRAPYNYKDFEVRLDEYMEFYNTLRTTYAEIISSGALKNARELFRDIYAAPIESVPEVKVLDFIFWSAGKLLSKAE